MGSVFFPESSVSNERVSERIPTPLATHFNEASEPLIGNAAEIGFAGVAARRSEGA